MLPAVFRNLLRNLSKIFHKIGVSGWKLAIKKIIMVRISILLFDRLEFGFCRIEEMNKAPPLFVSAVKAGVQFKVFGRVSLQPMMFRPEWTHLKENEGS
jgi:hypothetical protein